MIQGDTLGSFRLDRLIRMGSSCQVWEVSKLNTNERYALKILRPDFRNNKAEIALLKNEFKVARQLSHSSIITIHEQFVSDGTPYLVMELFNELNLKQLLRHGPATIAYRLENILQHCAESLSVMHKNGFIHGDIAPDNFLIDRDAETKLIDFAFAKKYSRFFLAKLFDPRGVHSSLNYMSPEQLRGQRLTPQTDIYSFGCVMFESVTGAPPYTGSSPIERIQKHISAPIPSIPDANVTRAFEGIVHKAMAKNPKHRFQSMWEVLQALKDISIFKTPPEPPESADAVVRF